MSGEGENYGTTYQKSSPFGDFPKRNSAPSYGKKTKSAAVHGGDQYGTTLQKSKPFKLFPDRTPAFAGNSMIGTQKSEG